MSDVLCDRLDDRAKDLQKVTLRPFTPYSSKKPRIMRHSNSSPEIKSLHFYEKDPKKKEPKRSPFKLTIINNSALPRPHNTDSTNTPPKSLAKRRKAKRAATHNIESTSLSVLQSPKPKEPEPLPLPRRRKNAIDLTLESEDPQSQLELHIKRAAPIIADLPQSSAPPFEVLLPSTSLKTIVFDLDETLVHCCDEGDYEINIPTASISARMNVRPFAQTCLKEASQLFEVVMFTASHQIYADTVLEYLDPEGYISHRFYRDHCVLVNGVYVKDLRILGNRNLKDVAIVDNSVYSFAYQLDNGIPITSWNSCSGDTELLKLIDYMQELHKVDDVRNLNREKYRIRKLLD